MSGLFGSENGFHVFTAYVLHCSSLDGWTPVEPAKLKKACINKCRLRIGQRKKLARDPYLFHSPQKSGPSYM